MPTEPTAQPGEADWPDSAHASTADADTHAADTHAADTHAADTHAAGTHAAGTHAAGTHAAEPGEIEPADAPNPATMTTGARSLPPARGKFTWQKLNDRAPVVIVGEPAPEQQAAAPEQAADTREDPMQEPAAAARLRRWWRGTLVATLVALFATYLLYRILHEGRLEQSALFYVGLPAVLAIVVALTARTRSAVGIAVVATTIGLALAGPLLGEGIVCLAFSAPLFYLVAVFAGLIVEATRRAGHRAVTAIAIVPVLLMCLEGVSTETSMPRAETVSHERVVHATAAEVEAALGRPPAYGRPTSAFLRLGFPRPLRATGQGLDEGDERLVTFTPRRSLGIGAEPTPRSMRLRVTESRPGRVVFTIVQDSTAARWLDFDTAEVTWRATGNESTTVRWTLRYNRTFDPSWYFGPLQRYGMTRVAGYLGETVTSPRDA